jgi:membrane-associated phospholipid phosphatase
VGIQAAADVEAVAEASTTPLTDIAARWRRRRRVLAAVYFAAVVWFCATFGVPTGRGVIAAIAITGLLVACVGRGWRQCRQVAVDWLPFTAVLLTYDQTRGLANKLGIPLHEHDILRAEAWTFGGVEPTVWLQHHLYNPSHVYWYDAALTLVYTSHFVATPALAAVLWLRDRVSWLRFVSRIVLLSVAGLVTYVVFPEAPPWMAARDGLSAPVERLSARGWIWLHAGNLKTLLERGQDAGSNPVAAMPSLHFAFAVLIALFIGHRTRSRWRWLLAAYPLAMGFALVYLGEHWVLDLAAGLAYALAAHLAMFRIEAWWVRRRAMAGLADVPATQLAAGRPAVMSD